MRHTRKIQILLTVILGLPLIAVGQAGRRGAAQAQAQPPAAAPAPPQQAAPPANAGRGGRGAVAAPDDFYDYSTTAGSVANNSYGPATETHQKITISGQTLAYTASVGYMPLKNATSGQIEAHLFYTSYAREGAGDGAARPTVFFFGGAPGVAATWQEFGGLGPKRVKSVNADVIDTPPYGAVENPSTLLGQADLVFVNPVGTAYSRAANPSHAPNFWKTAADIASLGDFVRSYMGENNRWNSPIFLAGEDLGTGRVAGLAAYLIEHQMPVRGVILFSMAMSPDAQAGDWEYLNLFPSMVTAAWYHKKLSPELNRMDPEQIAGQARQFASREYLHALYKGDRMTAAERTKVAADMSRLTGLSKAFLINNDLRVSLERFETELLHDQHQAVSRSDSRVSGFAPGPGAGGGRGRGGFGAPQVPVDANISSLAGGFLTGYETYLRGELNFKGGDGVFYLMSGGVGEFTSTGNDDTSLSSAFVRNPHLHLFVGINYFDLNAPFYATEYTLAHLNVSPEVRTHNITVSHYDTGEMVYADEKGLVKLHQDLASFIGDAMAPVRK